jgi:hypothetical protein
VKASRIKMMIAVVVVMMAIIALTITIITALQPSWA